MNNLILSGIDSINFINGIFRPDKKYIEHFTSILDKINNSISITNIENGYIAEVNNLDLSFIK